jgi:hypothetical protein
VNAADVKAALYGRHPATSQLGPGHAIPGPWTLVEEYRGIDVLALSAWCDGGVSGVRYPRVGYEVKASRSDYRREILKPGKRAAAVAWCNAFYMAVPKGLLTAEEISWAPPSILDDPAAFERVPCPGYYGERCKKDREWHDVRRSGRAVAAVRFGYAPQRLSRAGKWTGEASWGYWVVCPTCEGRGWLLPSVAERIAPTLWVPADVGLLEVDGRGCHVVKRSPVRPNVPDVTPRELVDLVRWVSVRPDPRHENVRRARAAA